jgi:extracellular factor (EF) 3-hydroxypalmitic acid methyl ester biosynthesis protein
MLSDPRQGDSTYFQIVNTLFLRAAVAEAHRNRIDILLEHLLEATRTSHAKGRQLNVLNVGCGPAIEIQRFVEQSDEVERLSFTLVDFSKETLDYARRCITQVAEAHGKKLQIDFVHESVNELLKRASRREAPLESKQFDLIYCAGLFDYLSDKVCARLLQYFANRCRPGGLVLVTNVHSQNPERNGMEHLLEWHLIYRDEAMLESVLPKPLEQKELFTDPTGVNVFAKFRVPK